MKRRKVPQQIRGVFKRLNHPVKIAFFAQVDRCEYCDQTRQLLEEVVGLSPLLSMQMYDLQADADQAAQYHVDKAPGFVLLGFEGETNIDYGISFSGMPYGTEFSSLINSLILVSTHDSGLSSLTREALKKLDQRVTLQVFTTPT